MSDFRLKVFCSVAKNLSFTKASQELFISQPAATKHIRELESLYHTRLFERLGSRISLTESGHLLLEHCERILADYRQLEYAMHQLHNEYSGQLRLGASTTIAQYVLPAVLASFTERYPNIRLTLMDTNSRNVERALESNDIDLGMVEGVFRSPNLKYEPFLHDELVPVANAAGLWTDTDEISVDELKQIPLVLRERGSGSLDAVEMALSEFGLKLSQMNVRLYLGSTESIKSFLLHSQSVGFISIHAVMNELREGKLKILDVEGLSVKRHFCFVEVHGLQNESVAHFVDYVRRYLHSDDRSKTQMPKQQ